MSVDMNELRNLPVADKLRIVEMWKYCGMILSRPTNQ